MDAATTANGFARPALYMTAGLLIWAANFLITYIFAAVACARGFSGIGNGIGLISVVTFVACGIAVLGNAAVIWRAWSRRRARGDPDARQGTAGFIDFIAAAVASISTVAVIWTSFVGVLPGRC